MTTIPTIDSIKALQGRNFARLNSDELSTLEFCRRQGRKYDVAISIISDVDKSELAQAVSRQQADEIMRRANSHVSVTIGPNAEATWSARQN